jgi:branched-chain amino acid transport system permease protein
MRTRFGSRLRAAVDNGRAARGLGINVNRLFTITFAVGSGLAGLAGALGVEILDVDPVFPVKFLVYFLIVVAVGGTGTIAGPLAAALILGIFDIAGKYYIPQAGAFIIYAVMVVMLIWRPQGLFGRKALR